VQSIYKVKRIRKEQGELNEEVKALSKKQITNLIIYVNTLLSILYTYAEGEFALISLTSYRLELFFAHLRFLCKSNNHQD
jgi:hypothetical protein